MLVLGSAIGLAPVPAQTQSPSYVGVSKCKTCHLAQFNIWSKSAHAKAHEVLGEDAGNPECLPCHSTGLEGPRDPRAGDMSGVQCEVCHGPGSLYKSPMIMSKSRYQRDPEVARKKALAAGLVLPGEKVCTSCHNEKSPTFKGFDFNAYKEKIKHWE